MKIKNKILIALLFICLVNLFVLSVYAVDTTPPSLNIETPRTVNPIELSEWQKFYVNFTYNETGNPTNYTLKIYNDTKTIHELYNDNLAVGKNVTNNITLFFNSSAISGYYNLSILMYDNESNSNVSYQNKSIVSTIISTSTTITYFKENSDLFIYDFHLLKSEIVIFIFLFFCLAVIIFVKIPLLLLSIGLCTEMVAFTVTDSLLYPAINLIIFCLGLFMMLKGIKIMR